MQIPFAESMLKYGNDKPDLRIPFEICDVTDIFAGRILLFLPKISKKARLFGLCLARNVEPGDC